MEEKQTAVCFLCGAALRRSPSHRYATRVGVAKFTQSPESKPENQEVHEEGRAQQQPRPPGTAEKCHWHQGGSTQQGFQLLPQPTSNKIKTTTLDLTSGKPHTERAHQYKGL